MAKNGISIASVAASKISKISVTRNGRGNSGHRNERKWQHESEMALMAKMKKNGEIGRRKQVKNVAKNGMARQTKNGGAWRGVNINKYHQENENRENGNG